MNPTATVRTGYLAVTVNGTALTTVRAATCSMGFDQQVMECSLQLVTKVGGPTKGDWIVVTMGASSGTAKVRFAGFFVEWGHALWPWTVEAICRGVLIKAQLYNNPTINGTDLSAGGAGQTDQAIVGQILTQCGVVSGATYTVSLAGLGRVLGKVATKYFLWYENDDGLSAIQNIDQVSCGYRTFEALDGSGNLTVTRALVNTVPSGSAAWTFTEGVDILEGTHQDTILGSSFNKFLVTGYNADKRGQNVNGFSEDATGGSVLPWPQLWSLSSSLIEYDTNADRPTGEGISCQQVVSWANIEYNRSLQKVPFTTPRDDLVLPGQVIQMTSSHLAILSNTKFWVQNVVNEITDQNVYSQRIVAVTGGS